MRLIPTLIIILVLILVNNLLLVKYLEGRFSSSTPLVNQEKARAEPSVKLPVTQIQNPPTKTTTENAKREKMPVSITGDEQEFIAMLRSVAKSGEFGEILSEVRSESLQRQALARERFSHMDASQLFDALVYAENLQDRNLAIGYLEEKGLHNLGAEQLRELYQYEGVNSYLKNQILAMLLERDDPQALVWAKEFINSGVEYYDNEVLGYIYEKDPAYIEQLIDGVNLQSDAQVTNVIMLLHQEPGLAQRFVDRHLDDLIDSGSSRVFQMGSLGTNIKLTEQQQNRVSELFSSSSRHKRQFALGLVGAIDDTELLKEAYLQLGKKQDKLQFFYSLIGSNNADKMALAKQLAADSDDSEIRRFAEMQIPASGNVINVN